jgi:hypothetical protein
MLTNVIHHPVVIQQAARRYNDYQLRIADRITAFAGSMLFVYLPSPCSSFGCWSSNAALGRR